MKSSMPRTFCLLNHQLTQKQITELETTFCSEKILYPEAELAMMWAQISPENNSQLLIDRVIMWLQLAKSGDYFVVQGEFGTTFKLVDYALKNNLIPIYATTKRIAKEVREGEQVHREYIFEHVCFKKYEYFEEKNESFVIL